MASNGLENVLVHASRRWRSVLWSFTGSCSGCWPQSDADAVTRLSNSAHNVSLLCREELEGPEHPGGLPFKVFLALER